MQGGNVNPCIGKRKVGLSEVKYGLEQWQWGLHMDILQLKQLFLWLRSISSPSITWRTLGRCKLLWEVLFIAIQMMNC